MGSIPTKEIKNARKHIHKILDPLWQNGRVTRSNLYKILSEFLGREYHTAEIRSVEEGREIYVKIKELYNELPQTRY